MERVHLFTRCLRGCQLQLQKRTEEVLQSGTDEVNLLLESVAVALHHVVMHCEAEEMGILVVSELDHHRLRNAAHGCVFHRRFIRHYQICIVVPVLRIN